MKRISIISLVILSIIVFWSCTETAEEHSEETTKTEKIVKDTGKTLVPETKRYKNALENPVCSEYLKRYKNWLDSYVQVRLKYQDQNSSDEAMVKYRQLVEEGKNIGDPPPECANEREFQDSLSNIDHAATKILEDKGFE